MFKNSSSNYKIEMNKFLNENKYFVSFVFATLLVLDFIWNPNINLVSSSGDANSIWQTITTYNAKTVISSYVLYKGILSVFPYVWLYDLSKYFNLDQFVFVKIYFSILYGLATGIAIPFVISKISNVKNNIYLNVICSGIVFYLLKSTGIFNQLMIDLPSFAFFCITLYFYFNLNFTLKSYTKINYLNLAFFAFFLGLTFTGSGQYSLACLILLIIYMVNFIINFQKHKILKYASKFILLFVIVFSVPLIANKNFENNFVTPLRSTGNWIPTSSQWFAYTITGLIDVYKFDGTNYKSNRGLAIFMDTKGEKYKEEFELIKNGGQGFTIKQYVNLIIKHPVDFLVMWGAKLFLAVSFDGGNNKVGHLFFSYTALFICLYTGLASLKNSNIFKNQNLYIFLSILCTVAAPVFLHIEMRYCITLFAFLCYYAIFITFANINTINYQNFKFKRFVSLILSNKQILITYILFTFYAFTMYGLFLEASMAPNSATLFK